jgi:DNA-binding transcriptional MerR regulator
VRAHVLRYWEEEFGILKPMKTRGAHRQYRRRDVELALIIKKLLHDEGFTVAGARKRLREMGHLEVRAEASREGAKELELRAELLAIRGELASLLTELERASQRERAAAARTTTVGADSSTGEARESASVARESLAAGHPSRTDAKRRDR